MLTIYLETYLNIKRWYVVGGKQSYWYENNSLERRSVHMFVNSLLYLYHLQMKYSNTYGDFIRKLQLH